MKDEAQWKVGKLNLECYHYVLLPQTDSKSIAIPGSADVWHPIQKQASQ